MYHQYSAELVAQYLKRLKGTEGETDLAAKSLRIAPATIRTWRKRHPEFNKQCEVVLRAAREAQVG